MGGFIFIGLAVFVWIAILCGPAAIRYRFGTPSEFAAGIARSMRSNPRDWYYDGPENFICSQTALIAIGVQDGNFGLVNTMQRSNQGTDKIDHFKSADRRTFRLAYRAWCELTALDRMEVVQRRKRDALAALNH